ncbi:hypothetical protein QCA50_014366 [Cerrena zonata]|uniref:Uncharacterized protein n=1 Tax=Cerrena zonata TaxID=2478898 RepID=A0AAW0FPD0_9APHY
MVNLLVMLWLLNFEPDDSLMNQVEAWVNISGTNVGFDTEVANQLSASSSFILPHRRYAMLTVEFRNPIHSLYLTKDGPDAEWNPHAEMSRSFYIHFSDWPMHKPWIQATQAQIERT